MNEHDVVDCFYIGIDVGTYKIAVCTSKENNLLGTIPDNGAASKSEEQKSIHEENSQLNDIVPDKISFEKELYSDTHKDNTFIGEQDTGLDISSDFKLFVDMFCCKYEKALKKNKTYAMIALPLKVDKVHRKKILELSMKVFSGAMIVDGPFCLAYNKGLLERSMIVDIGYSKTEICVFIDGNIEKEAYICSECAGKTIDSEICKLVSERWPDSGIKEYISREWKEEYGCLNPSDNACLVSIPSDKENLKVSVSEELQLACESVITEVILGITRIMSSSGSDINTSLRKNIHICGGTSKLENIGIFIENELKELGGGNVYTDIDHVFGISESALSLARAMPLDFWEQIIISKEEDIQ